MAVTGHEAVGRRYLFFGLSFLALGGLLAMLIRWQLGWPGTAFPVLGPLLFPRNRGVVPPHAYSALFTLHGTVMIFFALTPLLIGGLGNLVLAPMLGARRMALPRLNALSFWALLLSGFVLLASLFVPLGPAATGWTAYPPLSVAQPGPGQTLWVVAIFLNGLSSILLAVNFLTTIVRLRAPSLRLRDLPLTVWGLGLTSVLSVLFVPVLAAAMALLFCDRVFGTEFFVAGAAVTKGGGDPILYQHLFWIFGHPEVYILALPAWGMLSDLLSHFARRPPFARLGAAGAMTAITVISTAVYGHHMFVVGLSPLLSQAFMALTVLISVPSSVLFLSWLGTLYRGAIHLASPMLWSLGAVLVFGLGGLTGLHLGALTTDVYLHDSAFVVGHFHLTMAATVLFAAFGALHFWFPRAFGKQLDERLARWHFVLTLVPAILVFGGMLVLGYAGMGRRLYDPFQYDFLRALKPLAEGISVAAFVLGAAQLIFLYNVLNTLISGPPVNEDPWGLGVTAKGDAERLGA